MDTHEDRGRDAPQPSRRDVPDLFVEAIMRNPSRQRIMELLARTPGMNKNQLAEAIGIYPNALDFHIDRLREVGLVELRESPRSNEVVCFRAEDVDLWDTPATRVLFGRSPLRDVALYLAENPGAETKEVAEALDLTPVTVRHHLRELQENDLVQRLRIGRQVLYHPDAELEAWIENVGAGFERRWE